MTGSSTRHSILQHLVILATLAATLLLLSAPAQASVWKDRRAIKDRAKTQLGASYRYGGDAPSSFDCSGLTSWTFHHHGADLPHSSADQFKLAHRSGYKRIWKRKNLHRGDLVFFKTTSARVGHVGIFMGRGKFISVTSSSGVRVDSVHDPYYWGSRWVGATRVPALRRS